MMAYTLRPNSVLASIKPMTSGISEERGMSTLGSSMRDGHHYAKIESGPGAGRCQPCGEKEIAPGWADKLYLWMDR